MSRHIRRADWDRFTSVRYARERITLYGVETEAQLMTIDACISPYIAGRHVIGDTGYTWLQLAPKGGTWWMTAMYTPDGSPVQYYFDITAGNRVSGGKNASFEDMYLDVVLEPDGTYTVLDAEELRTACERGRITPAEMTAAETALARLLPFLTEESIRVFDAIRERLIQKIPVIWDLL